MFFLRYRRLPRSPSCFPALSFNFRRLSQVSALRAGVVGGSARHGSSDSRVVDDFAFPFSLHASPELPQFFFLVGFPPASLLGVFALRRPDHKPATVLSPPKVLGEKDNPQLAHNLLLFLPQATACSTLFVSLCVIKSRLKTFIADRPAAAGCFFVPSSSSDPTKAVSGTQEKVKIAGENILKSFLHSLYSFFLPPKMTPFFCLAAWSAASSSGKATNPPFPTKILCCRGQPDNFFAQTPQTTLKMNN